MCPDVRMQAGTPGDGRAQPPVRGREGRGRQEPPVGSETIAIIDQTWAKDRADHAEEYAS